MTPEQEALREMVGREIYDILEGPVADQDFGRQTRQWELSLVLADATIAVVLKEASRALEGDFDSEMEGYASHFRKSILSLIPQEEGE